LRLRRCASAATFRRSYTSSGMFFNVSVVGIAISNHNGTITVPLYSPPLSLPICQLPRIAQESLPRRPPANRLLADQHWPQRLRHLRHHPLRPNAEQARYRRTAQDDHRTPVSPRCAGNLTSPRAVPRRLTLQAPLARSGKTMASSSPMHIAALQPVMPPHRLQPLRRINAIRWTPHTK
jgi:hypothetical protein